MSQRSIVVIEINHDLAHRITDDPELLASLLSGALASGSDKAWANLRPYGIRRIVQAHHSEDRKVIIGGREYPIT